MSDGLEKAIKTQNVHMIMAGIPYARTIGMTVIKEEKGLLFLLPALESNIGNPMLPALHGGCIGGFMENAAIVEVIYSLQLTKIPKVINFSLDYIRPGRLKDTYAKCQIVRQGRKVINISITAWQQTVSEPIANARVHILL